MQTAEFDHNDFSQNNQKAGDEKLLVKFYIKARPDKAATLEEGRPMFKDVEYIDIRIPGSRDGVGRPATDDDKARFPRHYDAFKSRTGDEALDGTPLIEWPQVTRSQAEELSYFNCKTVEQLAGLNDSNCANFMGIQILKRKAQEWLDRASEDAPAAKLAVELEERDAKIKEQQATIDDLAARLTALENPEED